VNDSIAVAIRMATTSQAYERRGYSIVEVKRERRSDRIS
jgi:hypothetical protein